MKIAMLVSRFFPHIGGTETQALALSKELLRQGLEVVVLTERHLPNLPKHEVFDGVEVLRFGSPGNSILNPLAYIFQSHRFLSDHSNKVDLFHAHMIASPAVAACLSSKILHRPCLVKIASSGATGDIKLSLRSWRGRAKLHFVFRNASRFVCVSHETKDEILEAGASLDRIVIIPNGVNTSQFRPVESKIEKGETQLKLGLPAGRWILFTGRLTPQKRPDILLNATCPLFQTFPDIRLLFLGDGPEKESLERIIRNAGLQERVRIKQAYAPLDSFYRAADIFVLPSAYEGLSNSLLEALSSGLTTVASRVGGTVDVIKDGINGFLFPPGDSGSLTALLRRLLTQNQERENIQQAARETAVRHFSLKDVSRRYVELYQGLLKQENH